MRKAHAEVENGEESRGRNEECGTMMAHADAKGNGGRTRGKGGEEIEMDWRICWVHWDRTARDGTAAVAPFCGVPSTSPAAHWLCALLLNLLLKGIRARPRGRGQRKHLFIY
jgi:hypothetical protein